MTVYHLTLMKAKL